jgi:hypothetical protein
VLGEEDMFLTSMDGVMFDKEIYRARPLSFFRSGGLDALRSVGPVLAPPPALYLPRYVRIIEVLKKVKPALFVVDIMYKTLAADVARHEGFKYMMVSPFCSLDFSLLEQPRGKGLWKYPMLVCPVAVPFVH